MYPTLKNYSTSYILVILVSFLPIAYCQNNFPSLPCLNKHRASRVVGGSDAIKGEIPYIVSLTRRGGHFCGATVLNEKWLITAAHCMCNGLNKIMKASHIKGVIGLHKISDFKDNTLNADSEHPYEVDFKDIIVHADYKCEKPANDIALLELAKPIIFTDSVRPACIRIDTESESFEGVLATVSGWGWTNEDQEIGIRSDTLQKASVKIWNNDECTASFNKNGKNIVITSTQLCAGYTNGGIDSCWADSGGPLVSNDNILVGVVSTGIGCARPGLPGVYTRVSKYIKWIEQHVSS